MRRAMCFAVAAIMGCGAPTAPPPPPQIEVNVLCTLTALTDSTSVDACVERVDG